MKKTISATLAGALLLAGCANVPPPQRLSAPATTGEAIGAAAGAALGGAIVYNSIGSSLASGWGRVFMAALGASVGAYAGSQIGAMLSQADLKRAEGAANQAFSQSPNGQAVGWDNPDSGNSGLFMPTSTFMMSDGTLCRDYTLSVATTQASGSKQGTACRMSDGSWAATGLAG